MNREHLIEQAESYLLVGAAIPLDLYASLLDEGVDVENLTLETLEPYFG